MALVAVATTGWATADAVFHGKEGLLVIEVESTSSDPGQWKRLTSIGGFSGNSHFEFAGNTPSSGPAQNPLRYSFAVDKDGVYRLLIRCHKRLEGEEADKCNDCYIRLEGDFDTGGKVPLEILKSDTKLYGGSPDGWGWSANLDKQHKKFPPLYTLKAGEQYTLVISGRSQRFNMDRIVFKHESVDEQKAMDPSTPESPRN